jgi:glyoxylase-like metal-dependent hydrolase (beta-lactamase superfamily II)
MAGHNIPILLHPNVVRLGSRLVNWYLLKDGDSVTIVDAGAPGYRAQLEPGCHELGCTEADVAAVVLTHGHADHVGIAELVREELGVPIFVHAGDEELARTGKSSGKNERSVFPYLRHGATWKLLWELGRNGGLKPRPIKEVRTFADGEQLDVPGRLRVIHTPGHTDGHCVLVSESAQVVFGGDSICSYNPLSGVQGPQLMPSALNRDNGKALSSLDRLRGTGAHLLLPGHGEPLSDPDAAAEEAKRRGPT